MEKNAAMTKKILVVDDEPAIARLVRMSLSMEGFEVREAKDGEQALAMLAEWTPDLVVLDVMMPGMTGYDVCARLKKDSRALAVKVVFLTARGNSGDAQQGFAVGADDYMIKPFDPDELLAKVRGMLGVAA